MVYDLRLGEDDPYGAAVLPQFGKACVGVAALPAVVLALPLVVFGGALKLTDCCLCKGLRCGLVLHD
jgi:hypothetical protein